MQQVLKVKSIFLKRNILTGMWHWQFTDGQGNTLWRGEPFRMQPTDSAGLGFEEPVAITMTFDE